MRIQVGIVGQPNVTVTLFKDKALDRSDLENVTDKNAERVGLAIARKTLDAQVFPISVSL